MLLLTWDNKFDWKSLAVIFGLAIYEALIVSTILYTFVITHTAELNIGIAVALWSIAPFTISLMEKVVYNIILKKSQFLGMTAFAFMAILISL